MTDRLVNVTQNNQLYKFIILFVLKSCNFVSISNLESQVEIVYNKETHAQVEMIDNGPPHS